MTVENGVKTKYLLTGIQGFSIQFSQNSGSNPLRDLPAESCCDYDGSLP
jgi:hypothetical protein